MENRVDVIRFEDSLSAKIFSFLRSKGYSIATSDGVAYDPKMERRTIGILFGDPVITVESSCFGLIKKERSRKMFLGVIRMDEPLFSPPVDQKNWYFSIFSNEHLEMAQQLANELAETFDVNINIHLSTMNEVILERFTDEVGPYD